ILDTADLKCWGDDYNGQAGDGSAIPDRSLPPSTAIDLGTGRTAVAVSAGMYHVCAILDNGDLKCWGGDQYGQLGDGGTSHSSSTQLTAPSSNPIDLGSGRTAVAVSAGGWHTCAILDNGDLKCWGRDQYGQLGDGGTNHGSSTYIAAPSSNAIDLGTGRTAVAVSAGYQHTCALLDNGDVKCWGLDGAGQLGDGGTSHSLSTHTTSPPTIPINLGTGRTAVAISAGVAHTCAILDNGDLKCWGYGEWGQLGYGSTTDTYTPSSSAINLGSGRTAVALSAGGYHTCVILDNGDVNCWGQSHFGQVGDGGGTGYPTYVTSPLTTPIDLGTGRTAASLSGGNYHTCVILDNGGMKGWGRDTKGQGGTGPVEHTA
ncbi:MAG: hypothetical protein VXV98_09425, partial [Candidatus Thermoplasmatota archaeon]|nr:hypothetical protein [Candidatus Thermoplasmatota archaeon]